ncbi:MAG TPA: NHLP bacteriocin system secretion protein [Planctomycetota bacterium]|nr:NHLP bacteriocin system secretion protein [Planctomycetota bacterium]HQB01504.1 NHLP bacteriocin system secretion protein [Planctomycetota bacterium]
MFRQKALVKLKSPEQLDESIQIIHRMTKMGILNIILLLTITIIWAISGYIPETGRGQGILITPGTVMSIAAPTSGQILQWNVEEGDFIKDGEILGILKQETLEQTIQQTKERLQKVQNKQKILSALKHKLNQSERELIQKKHILLTKQIDYLKKYIKEKEKISHDIYTKDLEFLQIQKQDLLTQQKHIQEITQAKKQRVESYERLHKAGLALKDSFQNVKQTYEDSQITLKNLDLQIQDIYLKTLQTQEAHLNNQSNLSNLKNRLATTQIQLQELQNLKVQIDKLEYETAFQNKNELKELERYIEQSTKQLQLHKEIKSVYSGRVLELTTTVGQIAHNGQKIITIDTAPDSEKLVALAYFQDSIGKQLKQGMQVRISPSTVSQKQHGSMLGEIISVSEYPVTKESAINHIGNSNVATRLMNPDYRIEAFIKLYKNKDCPSGYQWTSKNGPDVQITTGTTVDIWVTVENRFPISFVIPKIREWLGL